MSSLQFSTESLHEVMEEGIAQILGRSPMPPGVVAEEACVHESDGFDYTCYDKGTPSLKLLMCAKCGCHYEEAMNGN